MKTNRFCTLVAAVVLAVGFANGATVYVDGAKNYFPVSSTWAGWGVVEPTFVWQGGGNGFGYDTTSVARPSAEYVQYQSVLLDTGLQIGNAPSLDESPLASGQRGQQGNGAANLNRIGGVPGTASAAPNKLDQANAYNISVLVVGRSAAAPLSQRVICGKRNAASATGTTAGYTLGSSTSGVAYFAVGDGSTNLNSSLGAGALPGGELYSLLGTFNRAAGITRVQAISRFATFFDTDTNSLVSNLTTTSSFTIFGRSDGNIGAGHDGSVFYVAVWLTPSGTIDTSLNRTVWNALIKNGSDLNSALPSIQSAVRRANNGAVGAPPYAVSVLPGIYSETVAVANDSITVSSYSIYDRPIIYGVGLNSSAGTTGILASVKTGVNYLTIRGFYSGIGLQADATSDGSLFHHLTIDSCLTGVNFDGAAANDSLVYCTIDGAGLANSYGFSGSTSGAGTWTLANNLIVNTNNAVRGRPYFTASQTVNVSNSWYYSNVVDTIYVNSDVGSSLQGAAIYRADTLIGHKDFTVGADWAALLGGSALDAASFVSDANGGGLSHPLATINQAVRYRLSIAGTLVGAGGFRVGNSSINDAFVSLSTTTPFSYVVPLALGGAITMQNTGNVDTVIVSSISLEPYSQGIGVNPLVKSIASNNYYLLPSSPAKSAGISIPSAGGYSYVGAWSVSGKRRTLGGAPYGGEAYGRKEYGRGN